MFIVNVWTTGEQWGYECNLTMVTRQLLVFLILNGEIWSPYFRLMKAHLHSQTRRKEERETPRKEIIHLFVQFFVSHLRHFSWSTYLIVYLVEFSSGIWFLPDCEMKFFMPDVPSPWGFLKDGVGWAKLQNVFDCPPFHSYGFSEICHVFQFPWVTK